MDPEALDSLLARAPDGGFLLERVARADFGPDRLASLHEFANRLMAEPFEHFAAHAHTNDELHVFRRRVGGDVVGFQFWRTLPGSTPDQRVVLGGKLRVHPAARRMGLHLVAGLSVLHEQRARFPAACVVRLGVVSLFGFVSLARRLSHYDFVDATGVRRALVPIVDEVTRVSRYRFDPATGLVHVGIQVTPDTLAGYPAAYFERPEARAYLARNPDYASNGCYLAFAFDVDEDNLASLSRGVAESVLSGR